MQDSICVAVLLATFNGEEFISEQLQSLKNQVGVCVHLFVHDDCSGDETLNILQDFNSLPLNLYSGTINIGPAAAFKGLLLNPELSKFEYIAFCDQDDIWHENKLQRAVQVLNENPEIIMYSSKRTIRKNHFSKLERHPKKNLRLLPTSLLFENKCYGNTIVFKKKNLQNIEELITKSGHMPHDLFMARVALMRGTVFVEAKSYVDYRIHKHNHTGLGAHFKILRVRIRKYPGMNRYFIDEYIDILNTKEHGETLSCLLKIKEGKFGYNFTKQSQLRFSKIEDGLFRLFLFFGYVPEIGR